MRYAIIASYIGKDTIMSTVSPTKDNHGLTLQEVIDFYRCGEIPAFYDEIKEHKGVPVVFDISDVKEDNDVAVEYDDFKTVCSDPECPYSGTEDCPMNENE